MDVRKFEIIVDNLEGNPHCLHGPTLIFQKSSGGKKYYACSACRDKKSCSFYLPVNEKYQVLTETSDFWKGKQKEILSSIEKVEPYKKFIEILRNLKNSSEIYKSNVVSKASDKNLKYEAGYCYTCNCLFESNNSLEHFNCNSISKLNYFQLTHPTSIIIPKTDAKTHAQYFFSESSVNDILLLLSRLKATKLLCIGVPKIHEYVLEKNNYKIKSLLLDFDRNYFNFYDKNNFIWYNMFNNYIFDEKQKQVLHKFLQSGKVVILMDPPFGGRVEPLARTLQMLNETFFQIYKNKIEALNKPTVVKLMKRRFKELHCRRSLTTVKNISRFDKAPEV